MEAAHVSPRAALPEPPGTGGGGRQRRTMSIHLGRLRMLIRVLAEAEKARSKTTLKTCQNNAFEKLLAYHTAAAESIENMKRLSEVLNERLDNTDLLLPNRRGYTPEGPDRLTLADEIVDFFSQPRANDAFETAQSPADVRMFDETLRKKLAADRLARVCTGRAVCARHAPSAYAQRAPWLAGPGRGMALQKHLMSPLISPLTSLFTSPPQNARVLGDIAVHNVVHCLAMLQPLRLCLVPEHAR